MRIRRLLLPFIITVYDYCSSFVSIGAFLIFSNEITRNETISVTTWPILNSDENCRSFHYRKGGAQWSRKIEDFLKLDGIVRKLDWIRNYNFFIHRFTVFFKFHEKCGKSRIRNNVALNNDWNLSFRIRGWKKKNSIRHLIRNHRQF